MSLSFFWDLLIWPYISWSRIGIVLKLGWLNQIVFAEVMGQKSNPEEFHQQLVGEMKVLSRSYVRVFLLPSYVGIITSHFKDSCELTSRMEWDKLFFPFLAQVE